MPSSTETSHRTTIPRTPARPSAKDEMVREMAARPLRFNSSKCKGMHLGRQNPPSKLHHWRTLATTTSEKDHNLWRVRRHRVDFRETHRDCCKPGQLCILVRPTLEYANAAWTHILRRDQILLKNVQRRATKLIPELRGRDYEDRLRTLKLPSLCNYRRARGDIIEAYKFTHSINKT